MSDASPARGNPQRVFSELISSLRLSDFDICRSVRVSIPHREGHSWCFRAEMPIPQFNIEPAVLKQGHACPKQLQNLRGNGAPTRGKSRVSQAAAQSLKQPLA